MKPARVALVMLFGVFLAACGGGGGGSGPTSTPMPQQNASPGGIWTGTDPVSGLQIEGLVDESGNFHFIRSDGAQYIGAAATSGNSLSSTFQGFTAVGYAWPDGSTHGTGSLSGTVTSRQTINAQVSFTTDAGSKSGGNLTLTFDSLYDSGGALSTIEGSYGDSYGDTATVYSSGQVFYQSASTGCSGSGTASVPNSQYDLYQVNITLQGCTGADAALNGVALAGEGAYNGQTSPAQLTVGLDGGSYAIVLTLSKN